MANVLEQAIRSDDGDRAASRRHGPSTKRMRASRCATPTGRRWRMSISRMSSGRRAAAKLLTHDEARRIATNIAKLPYLLQGGARA